MQACTYLNVIAGSVLSGLLAFAACGGAQSSPDAPSTTPVTSSSVDGPSAPTATVTIPPSIPPVASAAPTSRPPDRSVNDIRAVVASNRDAFRACYDRSQKVHPGIKGTFMLKFVLNPDGSVKSADADPTKSEIHAPDLETCAVGTLRTLKFPPSKRGMESTVNYPFDFNPKGSPKGDAGAP